MMFRFIWREIELDIVSRRTVPEPTDHTTESTNKWAEIAGQLINRQKHVDAL
jgi:hypothetical protein